MADTNPITSSAAPPASASGPPDAIKIPMNYPQPVDQPGPNLHFVLDFAEHLLKADPTKGQKANRMSQTIGQYYFCSLDPTAALNFPAGHRFEGKSRYNWVLQPDGISYGFLNDDAKADAALDAETKARLEAAYKKRAIEMATAKAAADKAAMAGRG